MGEKRHFTAMSSPNRKCLVRQVSAALTLLSLRQESLCSISTTGTLTPPTNVEVDAHCELISTCSSVTDDEEDDEQRSAVNQALGDTLRVVPERDSLALTVQCSNASPCHRTPGSATTRPSTRSRPLARFRSHQGYPCYPLHG
jgi:hypothetical protein